MTVLTDDLIEKAAEAIELVEAHSSEAYARACLTAVLPDVVEACAKVAEDNSTWAESAKMAAGMTPSPYELAEAIRSLLEGK
jgi:hypothetical protein